MIVPHDQKALEQGHVIEALQQKREPEDMAKQFLQENKALYVHVKRFEKGSVTHDHEVMR